MRKSNVPAERYSGRVIYLRPKRRLHEAVKAAAAAAHQSRNEWCLGVIQDAVEKTMQQRAVDVWNAQVPVGTSVVYQPVLNDPSVVVRTKTTKPAWLSVNGLPVVSIADLSGCVLLDHLTVCDEDSER